MISRWILSLMLLIAFSTIAWAHGGGQHVLGTVVAFDEKQVDVKTTKGGTVSLKLTPQTRFIQKGNAKSVERPAVGDRVVIEASKSNKVLTAIEVHYSPAKQGRDAAH